MDATAKTLGGRPLPPRIYLVFMVLVQLVVFVQSTYTECWNFNLYQWKKNHNCWGTCVVPLAVKGNIRNYCCNKCGCSRRRRLMNIDQEQDGGFALDLLDDEDEHQPSLPSLHTSAAYIYGDMEVHSAEHHGRELASQCPQKDGNNLPKCYTFFACKRCGKDWESANNYCPFDDGSTNGISCSTDDDCRRSDPYGQSLLDVFCFANVDCLWCNNFLIPEADCGVSIPEFTDNLGNHPYGGICPDNSQCCSRVDGPGDAPIPTYTEASTQNTFHFECITCPPVPVDPCEATSTRPACTTCLNSAKDTCMDVGFQACILDQCPQGTLSTDNNWCGVAHNDRRCGYSFDDANTQCGARCGIDDNCINHYGGERCFSDLDSTPCNGTDLTKNPVVGFQCPSGQFVTSVTLLVGEFPFPSDNSLYYTAIAQFGSFSCSGGVVVPVNAGANRGTLYTTPTHPEGFCSHALSYFDIDHLSSLSLRGCDGNWTVTYGDTNNQYARPTPCSDGKQVGGFRALPGLAYVSSIYFEVLCVAVTPPEALATNGYLGCWADPAPGGRDLVYLAALSGANFGSCQQLCASNAYTYFGLRDGAMCWCGNWYGTQGPSSSCSLPCSGRWSYQTCGGEAAISVYKAEPDNPGPPGEGYLGCFYDRDTCYQCVRDLPVVGMASGATYALCRSACIAKGYAYFGLQLGSQCWCGRTYGAYGSSPMCQGSDSTPCSADPSQPCGSYVSNSVYRIVVPGAVPPVLVGCPESLSVTASDNSGAVIEYALPTAGSLNVTCSPPSGNYSEVGDTTVYCKAVDTISREEGYCAFTTSVSALVKVFLCPVGDYVTSISVVTGYTQYQQDNYDRVQQLVSFSCSRGAVLGVFAGRTRDFYSNSQLVRGEGFCSVSFGHLISQGWWTPTTSLTHLSFKGCLTRADSPIYGYGQYDELTTYRCGPGEKLQGFQAGFGTPDLAFASFEPMCGLVSVAQDTVPPVFTDGCPADEYCNATWRSGAIATFTTPESLDAISGNASVTCDPPSNSLFAAGDTQVVCTAVDASGNNDTCSFTVSVTPLDDSGSPYNDFTCPAGQYLTSVTLRMGTDLRGLVSFSCSQGAVVDVNVGANMGNLYSTPTFSEGICGVAVYEWGHDPDAPLVQPVLAAYVGALAFRGCGGNLTETIGGSPDAYNLIPTTDCDVGAQIVGFQMLAGYSYIPRSGFEEICVRVTSPDVLIYTGYLGCYADPAPGGRDLPFVAAETGAYFEMCQKKCHIVGYMYFGLEGGQCLCGDRYGTQGPSTECSLPCSGFLETAGDSAYQTCGGDGAISVYKTDAKAPGPGGLGTAATYVGCFSSESRVGQWPTLSDLPQGYTAETCMYNCGTVRAYRYFSLQYDYNLRGGGSCTCGNDYDSTQHQSDCGTTPWPCTADQSQVCGGGYDGSMSLYKIVKDGAIPIVLSGCPDSQYGIPTASSTGAVVEYELPTALGLSASLNVSCFPPSGGVFEVGLTTVYCRAVDETSLEEGFCAFVLGVTPLSKVILCPPGDYVTSITLHTGVNVQQLTSLTCSRGAVLDVAAGRSTGFDRRAVVLEGGGFCSVSFGYSVDGYSNETSLVAHLSFMDCSTGESSPIYGDGLYGGLATYDCPAESKLAGFKVSYDLGDLLFPGLEPLCRNVSVAQDTVPPVFTDGCPASQLKIEATGSFGSSVTFTSPSAVDKISGNASVTCNPPSKSVFAVGNTTVVCSAADFSGNIETCSFTIGVELQQGCPGGTARRAASHIDGVHLPWENPDGYISGRTDAGSGTGFYFLVAPSAPGCDFVTDVNVMVGTPKVYYQQSLSLSIASPAGTVVILRTPSYNGEETPYESATFDDEAPDGKVTVDNWRAFGTYQSAGRLADFRRESPVGTWTLSAINNQGPELFDAFTLYYCCGVSSAVAPPALSGCPNKTISIEAPNGVSTAVTYNKPTAESGGAVTCYPRSGSNFIVGITTVMCETVDQNGNSATCTFSVKVSSPWCTNGLKRLSATSLPVGSSFYGYYIPSSGDNPGSPGSATRSMEIHGCPMILDLNVLVDVRHNNVENLDLTLTLSGGTTVVLASRIDTGGVPDFCNVLFDDDAPSPPTKYNAPWTNGIFQPAESLSSFKGQALAEYTNFDLTVTNYGYDDPLGFLYQATISYCCDGFND